MCLNSKNTNRYLDGLRKYKSKGVTILIDGNEEEEKYWPKILHVAADGAFYKTTYVSDESSGELSSIRFDKVHNPQFLDF